MKTLSLTQKVTQALKADKRPVREIAKLTGIQATRMHRICAQGFELKAAELEILIDFYQLGNDLTHAQAQAESILEAAHEEARTIKLHAYALGMELAGEDLESAVAAKYGIRKELLQWRLADPKLKALKEA